MPLNAIRFFGKTYGPYAFGVLSLLLVWFSIVAPELREARAQGQIISERQSATAAATAQITKNLSDIADVLHDGVTVLGRSIDVLDRISMRMAIK